MVDLHLGYAISWTVIGMIISVAMDEILSHIDLVISCKENLESLQVKIKSLETLSTRLVEYIGKSFSLNRNNEKSIFTKSALKNWVFKLQELHTEASAMEQNIPRIDVISRYRISNQINQKVSELDKHLKLVPLIQLELTLWMLENMTFGVPLIFVDWSRIVLGSLSKEGKVWLMNEILRHMKMVFCFNRYVTSFTDLVTSITPIIDDIWNIQSIRLSVFTMDEAINEWIKNMRELLERANANNRECVPWWNVICRYKKSKEITNLISDIDAHLKLASVILLEPQFQAKKDVKDLFFPRENGHQLSEQEETFSEMEARNGEGLSAAEEVEASTDEGVGAPEEVEASSDEGLRAPLLRGPVIW